MSPDVSTVTGEINADEPVEAPTWSFLRTCSYPLYRNPCHTAGSKRAWLVRTSCYLPLHFSAKAASTISRRTTNPPTSSPLRRCCPVHRDWGTLARHLVTDLDGVPSKAVAAELQQARHAAMLFRLELADALDCAEILVRYRVGVATGTAPGQARREEHNV